MKKITIILISFIQLVLTNSLFASPPADGFSSSPLTVKDKLHINAGVGFSNWGIPIYGGFDYGVMKNLSVGGVASFKSYSKSYLGTNYNSSIIMLGGRINYHFNELIKLNDNHWDVYGGGTLGYFIWNWDNNFPGANSSSLGIYAQIGGRYYFNPNWAANLELGGGSLSGGRLGITYRM
jgi:outer membrane immunogenic protein